MSDYAKQLQDYIDGTPYTECPHPLNRVQECGDRDICSLCGKTVYIDGHWTATKNDIERMWARLWGEVSEPIIPSDWGRMEDGELLDLCEGLQLFEERKG